MTTFAPNFTGRMRARYVAAGIEHTAQLRSERGASTPTIDGLKTHLQEMFAAAAAHLASDFEWIAVDIASTDSDVFNPVGLPDPVTGLIDPVDFSIQQRATSTGFVGRSAGSRASIFLYGLFWPDGLGSDRDNGRVAPGEDAIVAPVVAILNTHGHAGGGGLAIWHNYANIKVNDHLLKRIRSGVIS